jgi:hypothetical protein
MLISESFQNSTPCPAYSSVAGFVWLCNHLTSFIALDNLDNTSTTIISMALFDHQYDSTKGRRGNVYFPDDAQSEIPIHLEILSLTPEPIRREVDVYCPSVRRSVPQIQTAEPYFHLETISTWRGLSPGVAGLILLMENAFNEVMRKWIVTILLQQFHSHCVHAKGKSQMHSLQLPYLCLPIHCLSARMNLKFYSTDIMQV